VNVRQPLARLFIKKPSTDDAFPPLSPEFLDLIRDEINVKEVAYSASVPASTSADEIELDTVLTPKLIEEGTVRELTRAIQDIRKKKNLTLSDVVSLHISTDAPGRVFVEAHATDLARVTGLSSISYSDTPTAGEEEVVAGAFRFGISLS
jgi:isoleucyl-tRNA synthetase